MQVKSGRRHFEQGLTVTSSGTDRNESLAVRGNVVVFSGAGSPELLDTKEVSQGEIDHSDRQAKEWKALIFEREALRTPGNTLQKARFNWTLSKFERRYPESAILA